jgi:cyclopropane fatty-acyl-phospholipid synthase-like methyltransferase
MAATAGHRLTLDPMRKYSNAFFSETANMIKAKLYMCPAVAAILDSRLA